MRRTIDVPRPESLVAEQDFLINIRRQTYEILRETKKRVYIRSLTLMVDFIEPLQAGADPMNVRRCATKLRKVKRRNHVAESKRMDVYGFPNKKVIFVITKADYQERTRLHPRKKK